MSSGGFWFGDRPFAVAPRGGLVVAGAGLEADVQDAGKAAGQSWWGVVVLESFGAAGWARREAAGSSDV